MKHLACLTAAALAAFATASPGDNWSVVTWNGAATSSYLWDFTEGQASMTNVRQFSLGGWDNTLVHDVDYDSNGVMYANGLYWNNNQPVFAGVFIVDQNTANLTQVASVQTRPEGDMAYDPVLNRLVVTTSVFGTGYGEVIDLNNNYAVSGQWTVGGFDDVSGSAIDSGGNGVLLDAKSNSGGIGRAYSFTTAQPTFIGALTMGPGVTHGLDFNGSDKLHLLTGSNSLYTLTGTTTTFVQNVGNPLGQLTTGLAYKPVPEPATIALVSAGIIGLLRRKATR